MNTKKNYYSQQLARVKPYLTEYAPSIKVFSNGNGEDTNFLTLNEETAKELIYWLSVNYLNGEKLEKIIEQVKIQPLNP